MLRIFLAGAAVMLVASCATRDENAKPSYELQPYYEPYTTIVDPKPAAKPASKPEAAAPSAKPKP